MRSHAPCKSLSLRNTANNHLLTIKALEKFLRPPFEKGGPLYKIVTFVLCREPMVTLCDDRYESPCFALVTVEWRQRCFMVSL